MDDQNTDVIRGTLDVVILKTLSLEPMHGFGIARQTAQMSRGVFTVNPGSLLTALRRLERAGEKLLELETADWTWRASAIARLLRAEG